MSRLLTYLIVSFVAVSAFAEEIDAEILKHLDFFEKMPVVEELDLIELEEQTRPPADTGDTDSLDDAVQGASTSGSAKGEGQ